MCIRDSSKLECTMIRSVTGTRLQSNPSERHAHAMRKIKICHYRCKPNYTSYEYEEGCCRNFYEYSTSPIRAKFEIST